MMKLKWLMTTAGIFLFCLVAILSLADNNTAIAAGNASGKIETTLLDQINSNGAADFIIHFTDRADLSPAFSMDWEARGEFVYKTLQETAQRSQASAKKIIDAQGLNYRTFIASNDLYVYGSNAAQSGMTKAKELFTLTELAAMPEVSSIRATRTYSIDPLLGREPLEPVTWVKDLLFEHLFIPVVNTVTATLDWGITDTKANQFWTTFQATGNGIVVANIDTGVQWNHPALERTFKCGNNPSDPQCWYDPANVCGGSVCDNNGHGTHTMGTMVGDNDPTLPYDVGMAPDATWIACKGCESNKCSNQSLLACADWILAPGGNPANRPSVVNNSWGGSGGDTWFQLDVDAWRAAGIFPAFSAGNSGPGCSTLGSPGDYQSSFSSAAHNSSRSISSFSSRGPGSFGDTPYTKPNISAPGEQIISSYINDQWASLSGTSMASPHVSGAVALLWSCNPSLSGNIDATFRLLSNTADPAPTGDCGAPPAGLGNYTYGYGYLDVLAAGQATCNIISSKVVDVSLSNNLTRIITLRLANKNTSAMNWTLAETPYDVQWLNETPISGTIPLGGQIDISFTFNTTGLATGIYQTKLIIQSNDPYTPILSLPITLHVGIPIYIPAVFKH